MTVPDGARRVAVLLLVVVLAAMAEALLLAGDAGRIPLVGTQPGLAWLRLDEPVALTARPLATRRVGFRRTIVEREPGAAAPMPVALQGHRALAVHVNGVLIGQAQSDADAAARWVGDLAPYLRLGDNELFVIVARRDGPPLLAVREADAAGAGGAVSWQASGNGVAWPPARDALPAQGHALSAEAPSATAALGRSWPAGLAIAGAGALLALAARRRATPWPGGPARALQAVHGVLLALLSALLLQNLSRVDLHVGMDLAGHLDYVEYILQRGRLPLATEGWQMFQPPLAHLLLAAVQATSRALGWSVEPALAGRALAMAATVLAAHAGCRFVRAALPGEPAAQAVGMMVAVSLPASIVIAHAFGNEPFFACLAAFALHARLAFAAAQPGQVRWAAATGLGLLSGLAVLAKTSAVLLVFALALSLWFPRRRDARAAAAEVGAFVLVCAAVAGWWYARNWIELGRPFVGGWEAGRGIDWWQYPGYRTPGQLLGFGTSLLQPVYAGLAGFWDGLHATLWADGWLSGMTTLEAAPRWRLETMALLPLLALAWVAAAWAGVIVTVWQGGAAPPPQEALGLALGAGLLLLFIAAMFHLYAGVPIYSAAKGTYLAALAPCVGALAARGLVPLLRRAWGQAAVGALLAAWLAAVGHSFTVAA